MKSISFFDLHKRFDFNQMKTKHTLGLVLSREIPAKSSGNEDQTEEKQRRVCLNGCHRHL
jgi:hypothetical protein